MTKTFDVGIVGYKCMGKAHSAAYHKAARFFDLKSGISLKVACGRQGDSLWEFAENWGWQETETSWGTLERDDIDIRHLA